MHVVVVHQAVAFLGSWEYFTSFFSVGLDGGIFFRGGASCDPFSGTSNFDEHRREDLQGLSRKASGHLSSDFSHEPRPCPAKDFSQAPRAQGSTRRLKNAVVVVVVGRGPQIPPLIRRGGGIPRPPLPPSAVWWSDHHPPPLPFPLNPARASSESPVEPDGAVRGPKPSYPSVPRRPALMHVGWGIASSLHYARRILFRSMPRNHVDFVLIKNRSYIFKFTHLYQVFRFFSPCCGSFFSSWFIFLSCFTSTQTCLSCFY